MKKILIITSCALTLCFTSCATKQAPQTDSQTQAPQTETESPEETEDSKEATPETDSSENQGASDYDDVEDVDETVELELYSSEDFPELENIDDPEIITLEPEEENVEEENTAAEEVEMEEPPEISVVNSNEENERENPDETETSGKETDSENESASDENNIEDISDNDVIIVSDPDSDGISGGIDITDEDSASSSDYSEMEKDITPSRSVTLKKFEYLDVIYPGNGWIYMGLTDNSKDLAYFGRKLGTKETKFSLQARAAGTKIIHFYRNDPLTGQYLDDYIEVIITSENGSNKTHVEAPEYKLPVQKKEKPASKVEVKEETDEENKQESKTASPSSSNQKAESSKGSDTSSSKKSAAIGKSVSAKETESTGSTNSTDSQTSSASGSVSASANPDSLLQEAQLLYNEKEYCAALNKLNQYFEYSTDKGDQALYLKGQILEAKSDVRDIKGAIDAYTTLTKNYPASSLWDSANKRIIYLKRFYLEVR